MWIWFCVALVWADVPPDGPETCKVESSCAKGQEATSCSANMSDRSDCEALEADGWTKECQTQGASVWTEVMCKGEPSDDDNGCDQSQVGAGAAGLGVVIGASLLLRRRRRAA